LIVGFHAMEGASSQWQGARIETYWFTHRTGRAEDMSKKQNEPGGIGRRGLLLD